MDNLIVTGPASGAERFSRAMRLHLTLGCDLATVSVPAREAIEVCDLIDEALDLRRKPRTKPHFMDGFGGFYLGVVCGMIGFSGAILAAAALGVTP